MYFLDDHDDVVLVGIHRMLDHIQDTLTQDEYYRLNHIPAAEIGRLADYIRGWLYLHGIDRRE
jgi:hypothetical protein